MTIQLIVHGDTEYYCLPSILKKFGVSVLTPFNLQGKGFGDNRYELVKEKLVRAIELVRKINPGKIIIVTDKEEKPFCPGELSSLIKKQLLSRIEQKHGKQFRDGLPEISVVIANSCYENWLIADPEGIAKSRLLKKQPNIKETADSKPAIRILNGCMANHRKYDKRSHAPKFTALADFKSLKVRARSKSLRKFLKEAGCVNA